MKYSLMTELVRKAGRFGTPEEAERAIKAVAEVLACRLSADGSHRLASQLPKEVAAAMNCASEHGNFGLPEFFDRVAEKLGIEPAPAMHHAEAALAVLQDAVPTEVWERVFRELDPEYIRFLNSTAVTGKREGFVLSRAPKSLGRSDHSS